MIQIRLFRDTSHPDGVTDDGSTIKLEKQKPEKIKETGFQATEYEAIEDSDL